MTDRATLEALLARVLEGEGPDRELDAEIARMLLPPDADAVTRSRYGWSYRVFGPDGWDDEWLENKFYTASLDAALTLLTDGWDWVRRTPGTMALVRSNEYRMAEVHPEPCRALIAAWIKARMEELSA